MPTLTTVGLDLARDLAQSSCHAALPPCRLLARACSAAALRRSDRRPVQPGLASRLARFILQPAFSILHLFHSRPNCHAQLRYQHIARGLSGS